MMLRSLASRSVWAGGCGSVVATTTLLMVAAVAASTGQTKPVPPVAAAALQKLLPTVDGWASGAARADLVEISPDAKYSFASVTFTKDDLRVKLTLADTGFSPDSLIALATMIITMPDDYSGEVQGLAIKRTKIGGSPAVEAWNGQKSVGEIAVVVGGRFVVALEASKVDGLDTLRGMLEKVDLKALSALNSRQEAVTRPRTRKEKPRQTRR